MEMEITLGAGLAMRESGGAEATTQRECVLRSLRVGDVLDAECAAERIFVGPTGPTIMSSPSLFAAELLRRRIRRIGMIEGPTALSLFRKLTPAPGTPAPKTPAPGTSSRMTPAAPCATR